MSRSASPTSETGPLDDRRGPPDRRLLARRQLPVGRPDLPARQSAPARAACPRARQAAPARPLGNDAGPELHLRPHEPRDPARRPRRDLHRGTRARRSRSRGECLPRGDLHGDVPGDHPRRGGSPQAVPTVLVPRWDPEPRRAGDARLDPRRRRARLRPRPRVRRRLRQPGPARLLRRRRRRGRDGTARRELALEQVPQPRAATEPSCRSCT